MKANRGYSLLVAASVSSCAACEACNRQSPRLVRGLFHGAGPQGPLDYAIVIVTTAAVLAVMVAAIRCLLRPAETDTGHIKRLVLDDL